MEYKTAHESTMDALEGCLNVIHDEMTRVADTHWSQIEAHEKKVTEWSNKSQLRLVMHRKGNHIQAKWNTIKWFGKKGARKDVKTSIRKSVNEDTYSLAELKANARDWEWAMVEKTELQMGLLRKQAGFIVKAITAMRYAGMAAQKYTEQYGSDETISEPEEEALPA